MSLNNSPMDSFELNKTFESRDVLDAKEKLEKLLNWGINPDFAEQLNEMFSSFNVAIDKITSHKEDILESNERIKKGSKILTTKARLGALMDVNSAANYDKYSDAA